MKYKIGQRWDCISKNAMVMTGIIVDIDETDVYVDHEVGESPFRYSKNVFEDYIKSATIKLNKEENFNKVLLDVIHD